MSKLKEIRKTSGLSQSGLSESSGVNVRMIQHYEQGIKDINKANGETLYKLSKALNCKMEDLLELK
jgi:transcriptional regulator with XRE-family HTH domain